MRNRDGKEALVSDGAPKRTEERKDGLAMKVLKRGQKLLAPLWVLTTVASLAACDGDGTGPGEGPMREYAGTWMSTATLVQHKDNPLIAFDVVAYGGTLTFHIEASGHFSGTAAIPSALLGRPGMGTITVPLLGVMQLLSENTVWIRFTPEMPPLFQTMNSTFVRNGRSLTLTDDEGLFDFNFDGVPEPRIFMAEFKLK